MTIEEKIQRVSELEVVEANLKSKRDFFGLIAVFEEYLSLFDTISNHAKRIPQIAYCYARLGNSKKAEDTLKRLQSISLFVDNDELFRAVSIVSFFISSDAPESNLMITNTIKNWLQDPDASKQVVEVMFDYMDFVDNVTPFDHNRLHKKQTYFSEDLIECVFSSMMRDRDTVIYYNKEKNDVQQEVNGYLTSHLAVDQSAENRKLADRITKMEPADNIVDGIHYLIPQLFLIQFIDVFRELAKRNERLLDFLNEFEEYIMDENKEYVDSIEDLAFSDYISKSFNNKLDSWYMKEDIEFEDLKEMIDKTREQIGLAFLKELNK